MPLDSDTLDRVKQLFVVTMPQELGKGRDAQKYGRSYQNLEVTCAWRLEYPSQWLKYAAERNSVNMNMQQLRRQAIPLQTWTSKLEAGLSRAYGFEGRRA